MNFESKDDFVKKSLPLSTRRNLSILLSFPFPSVSFSGVSLTWKCKINVNQCFEQSHFRRFLSKLHIFTWTTRAEKVWPRGIMTPMLGTRQELIDTQQPEPSAQETPGVFQTDSVFRKCLETLHRKLALLHYKNTNL